MFRFTTKTRNFIVDEKDVTTILDIINRKRRQFDYQVGSCGWSDDTAQWFIMFHATDKVYGDIVRELMTIGKLNVDVRPGGQVDLVFEMGS